MKTDILVLKPMCVVKTWEVGDQQIDESSCRTFSRFNEVDNSTIKALPPVSRTQYQTIGTAYFLQYPTSFSNTMNSLSQQRYLLIR